MEVVTKVAELLEGVIQHTHFVSLALGLIISTCFTQLAKYPVRVWFYRKGLDPLSRLTPEIEVEFHRWLVRLVAVVSGALGTFLTWPDGTLSYKLVWSLAVGLASPGIYALACHWWPWLGEKTTADKIIEPPKP
jgi:hypothetical protein